MCIGWTWTVQAPAAREDTKEREKREERIIIFCIETTSILLFFKIK